MQKKKCFMHVKEQKRRHSKQLQSVLIKKKRFGDCFGQLTRAGRSSGGDSGATASACPSSSSSIEDEAGSDPLHSSNSGSGIPVIQEAAVSAVCTPTG